MAEAAAAFYTIETAVEGAAVGAIAVAQSTTPLHIRFRKLQASGAHPPWKATVGHTFDVVKGKAYIFGGDVKDGVPDNLVSIITLPSDIENGELDYQRVQPTFEQSRPLQQHASTSTPLVDSQGFESVPIGGGQAFDPSKQPLQSRTSHASTSIGPDVFMFAGRASETSNGSSPESHLEDHQFFNCDQILSFSTQTNKWSIIQADMENCKAGLPAPRTGGSCVSTPHPQPDSAVNISIRSHGTIFLHGGYDTKGQPLRDTWAFDVSSRVWTPWPDIPDPLPEEVAGEGRIACVHKRLWRAGDGFGKMMHLDFEVSRGDIVTETSGPHSGETSIQPANTKWERLSFGEKAADTALQKEIGAGSGKSLINKAEHLPVPRQGAGFLPVRLGAGRSFLLYFMGQDGPGSVLNDVWSFQIKAEDKTPAAMKDAVRSALGRSTGENEWALCDVVESTKVEGEVDLPQGLTSFDADNWIDLGGGNICLWGGVDTAGLAELQCWVMSVQ